VVSGAEGTSKVIVAFADLVESATLVAVTVTACCVIMLAGAVKTPPVLMLPTLGLRAQFTAVLEEPPVTVAVNCSVCKANSEAVAGVTETLTDPEVVVVAVTMLE